MNFASLLQGFVALLWVVVVVLLVLAVLRASRRQKVGAISTAILVATALAIILTTVSAGLVFVQPDQRGVVISALAPKGYREEPLQPGLRWIIPFFENVVFYPISRQSYTMSIAPLEGQMPGDDSVAARTSDGQEIFLDASIIYAIDPADVVNVHIVWQDRFTDELVRPLTRGIIRDAVSQYGVQQVYSTQRAAMTEEIRKNLTAKLADNGLILSDFVLRNITFSPEYAASVEQKQIAEQLAQQAKFVVEQRKQEAEQARQSAQGQADSVVIRAQGDAEARLIAADAESKAINLIAEALIDKPELLTYQYITKLAPGVQVMLVPNNAPYLLPLPTLEAANPVTPTEFPTPLPTAVPTTTP